jgi:UDP-glucose 4-epimerase
METQMARDTKEEFRSRYNRALVTGGAGFVGSHLIDSLLSIGVEVVSLDDFSAGKEVNIAHHFSNPKFKSIRADVTNLEAIRPHFDGVDVVFHQACSKNTICMRDPARDLAVNAEGTLNILLCAKELGAKRVVHASTGSVYGEPQYFPTPESHPLHPVSYYGVSKLAGERYAILFNSLHNLPVVALRYFHVYGPRQDNSDVGGVVSIFCRRAHEGRNLIIYGDGTQVRSFTYVGDVVRSNILAAIDDGMVANAYNAASGVKITIKELADRVLGHYERRDLSIEYAPWKPGDIRNFDVDNSALRSRGFVFEKDFEAGLQETLRWTRQFIADQQSTGQMTA